jgi:hypothetical protein
MSANDTNISGVPVAGPDRETEFMLFDLLPVELREVLNYCPIKATVVTLYQPTFTGGYKLREGILERWKDEFRDAFPSYQPIKGDNFPV